MEEQQIMKKNRFLKLISVLLISAASLVFTSCLDIIVALLAPYGTLESLSAIGLSEAAYLTWANGAISRYTLTLDVSPNVAGFPRELTENERNNKFLVIKGLENETKYTFTLTLRDGEDVISTKTAEATPSTTNVRTLDYNNGVNSIAKLDDDEVVVTLSGVNGKVISYANVNMNKTKTVSASSVRRYVGTTENSISANVVPRNGYDVEENLPEPVIKHFVPPASSDVKVVGAKSRSGDEYNDTFDITDPKIGQTRSIYVDQDSNLSTLDLEEMTLYAIGYEPRGGQNDIACLVWARKSDVTSSSSSGTKISIEVIKDIASKFVTHYQFEEKIFGETCDRLFSDSKNSSSISMTSGPTKDYVNIVLWDIGKDGTSGKCGVVGYFWAKDYYESDVISYSNEGKYFYIDIPFCNYKKIGTDVTYDGNDNTVSDTVISTLFHEYQHMIDFNTKNVKNNLSSVEVWYNEMLSMLCEDLLGDALGLEEGEKVYDGRIPNFNGYYYYSGIAQYLESNSWVSYATAYTFGAFLMRNYGGTKLVREMSRNAYSGIESIVKAVNSVNGTTKKWEDLVEEYIKACAFRASYAKEYDLPTLNKTRTGTDWVEDFSVGNARVDCATNKAATSYTNGNVTGGTLSTSVRGINLWDRDLGNTVSSETYYGPINVRQDADIDLQPTGFIIHPIGKATSDDVTLFFTSPTTTDEKLWIFIQDDYSPTTADSTAAEVIN